MFIVVSEFCIYPAQNAQKFAFLLFIYFAFFCIPFHWTPLNVPRNMAFKPTPTPKIAINSFCVPMALWLWRPVKTVCYSTARVLCTTTAIITGLSIVKADNGIVSTNKNVNWIKFKTIFYFPLATVNINLSSIPSLRNVQQHTSSLPSENLSNRSAMPVWPMMSVFMAAIGPINFWIVAILKVSKLDNSHNDLGVVFFESSANERAWKARYKEILIFRVLQF